MSVTSEKIDDVAQKLWLELYELEFRGKSRGRFSLSREQMKQALGVKKLHTSTIEKLQEACLGRGLAVIDLDDIFPCIEVDVLRKYRRPPKAIFDDVFSAYDDSVDDDDEWAEDL
jgi:hypothetical protein